MKSIGNPWLTVDYQTLFGKMIPSQSDARSVKHENDNWLDWTPESLVTSELKQPN